MKEQNSLLPVVIKKGSIKRFFGKIISTIQDIKDKRELHKLGVLEKYDVILKRENGTYVGLKKREESVFSILGLHEYEVYDTYWYTRKTKARVFLMIVTEMTIEALKIEELGQAFVSLVLDPKRMIECCQGRIGYVGQAGYNKNGILDILVDTEKEAKIQEWYEIQKRLAMQENKEEDKNTGNMLDRIFPMV